MFSKLSSFKRYIIIGDVHGCLNELKSLWNKLSISSSDKVIFLGDLVDKGPDSDGVVTFVREKKESGFKITLVEGNHEEKRINKFYKATPSTEYTADDPWVSGQNIDFLETSIPYYRFKSGDKSFMCVHGGIYPAFKSDLMENKDLDSMYSGARKADKAIKALMSSLNILKEENNALNKISKQDRTLENKLRLKALPSEITTIQKDIQELKETNVLSKEIKDHLNRLKRFFITRYVDETGQVIPMDPKTMKPTREGVYWTETYTGKHGTVFYGHEPYDEVSSTAHTHGIDTGAVYGGKLTAAIVQDGEVSFVSQKSEKMYKSKHAAIMHAAAGNIDTYKTAKKIIEEYVDIVAKDIQIANGFDKPALYISQEFVFDEFPNNQKLKVKFSGDKKGRTKGLYDFNNKVIVIGLAQITEKLEDILKSSRNLSLDEIKDKLYDIISYHTIDTIEHELTHGYRDIHLQNRMSDYYRQRDKGLLKGIQKEYAAHINLDSLQDFYGLKSRLNINDVPSKYWKEDPLKEQHANLYDRLKRSYGKDLKLDSLDHYLALYEAYEKKLAVPNVLWQGSCRANPVLKKMVSEKIYKLFDQLKNDPAVSEADKKRKKLVSDLNKSIYKDYMQNREEQIAWPINVAYEIYQALKDMPYTSIEELFRKYRDFINKKIIGFLNRNEITDRRDRNSFIQRTLSKLKEIFERNMVTANAEYTKSKHAQVSRKENYMRKKGYWVSFSKLIKLASDMQSYDIGDDPDKLKHFRAHIPAYIIGIFQMLRQGLEERGIHNAELYLVGGVVRDLLEKKVPKDFDITSNVDPEIMREIFEEDGWHIKEAGTDFKVLHVSKGGIDLEVARFRKDIHKEKNKTEVAPGTIYDDAARRDLTVNALYLDPVTGKVFDPSGKGLYALGLIPGSKKKIEFMGDPEQRIEEDYSRILRFFRFANKFKDMGFEVDSKSLDAVKKNFHAIQKDEFDHNRIREEFEKMVGLKKVEEKLEDAMADGKIFSIPSDSIKPYHKNKKVKVLKDAKKVFKILTAISRLAKLGYIPDSHTVRALRNSMEELKQLDTAQLISAVEKLSGLVEDVDADNLEKSFKALVDEYDELMSSERTSERERRMYDLRATSQDTFRDYFEKEGSYKRYCEYCGGH